MILNAVLEPSRIKHTDINGLKEQHGTVYVTDKLHTIGVITHTQGGCYGDDLRLESPMCNHLAHYLLRDWGFEYLMRNLE